MSSVPVQLLTLLWREPGREWRYPEMTADLSLTREQLHHPLSRLLADDRLERVGRGLYRVDPERHLQPQGLPEPAPQLLPCPVTAAVQKLGTIERQCWALLHPDRPLTVQQVACRYGMSYSLAERSLSVLVRHGVAELQDGTYTRRAS
ncbi:hypothetical protein [Deinococcus sp. Leaf326]|uniref:hypothetical protein n=1 Tax=Deinococcus sp. Leaf326 TaxID=1736338 RepID=UPI0006FF5846|nr:hypothetical protein [Deinococcus sp. Leaf326]KQR40775.1 hypothetical protein ASF71_00990 [Deinococcus sp. Leaf326]